ncbi:MAG: beta-glucosidase [Candidatus Thorarchaeota archaeon]
MATNNHQSPEDVRAREILSRMTLKDKFQSLTSPGFHRIYVTKPIKRLGVPSFRMTDGPLGVAYHSSGLSKCTRFPAAISVASGWNRQLAREMGVAMAKEVRAVNRHMLLAPGVNIDRTPLNGRTFEYYGEDPFLTKELAIPLVQGVQSIGVGACVKHYAANNQEIDRRSCNSVVDERTLHEVYLRAFRDIVTEADPWAIMGSYNKINGVYGCEHKYLIREVLMGRWGFKGFVVSDWLATRPIETTEGCINAGLSLEMPFPSKYKQKALHRAFDEGKFTEEALDDLVFRFLRVMILTGAFEEPSKIPQGIRNTVEHQFLARRIAEEGMVLLKNRGDVLPLNFDDLDSISVSGPNLKKKFGRILSGGSSAVVALYEITPLDGIKEKIKGKIEIISDVSKADAAIIFAGLNHSKGMDSESYDRTDLQLPEEQVELILETASDNPNTIIVLIAGSPIAMDSWYEKVPVILNAWYPGMEGGRAIANILFGDAYPSGKLPLTFPQKLSDSPAHHSGLARNYPGDEVKDVYYDEGIFIGYRWFDKKEIEPLFPFGFGLGYTRFDLGDIELEKETEEAVTIKIEIENSGERMGSEVLQVYSHDVQSSVERPLKELVGFEKVVLNPSERKIVPIQVRVHDLMFYDVDKHDWHLEPGEFELQIGNSSRNIFSKVNTDF